MRLGQSAIVLALSSVIVFALIRSAPGNPAEVIDGFSATPAEIAATSRVLGLDRPIVVQYGLWVGRLARGEFGSSITDRVPVSSLIGQALPATLWLLAGSMFIAIVGGLSLGLISAGTRRRWLDTVLGGIMALLYGTPTVWVGLLAILLFAVRLRWLPPAGYVSPIADPLAGMKALLLPSVVLGLGIAGIEGRFVRGAVGESMAQDFALAARAKGGRRSRVLLVHAARNGLLPVITTYGMNFAYLLGGSVVVEVVFTWPGIGNLLQNSIQDADYPTIQGLIMIFVAIFAVVNLLTDLAYGLADPRLRAGMRRGAERR